MKLFMRFAGLSGFWSDKTGDLTMYRVPGIMSAGISMLSAQLSAERR